MSQTVVITGASDGIGAAAARQLRGRGERVVLVGRSEAKTEAVASELNASFHVADFAKLADVRRLASELETYDRIDVLANNAGGIMGDRVVTEDGFEKTFQVNHLAPFLLTQLLIDKLIASNANVIQTSSVGSHGLTKGLDLNDLNHARKYSFFKAYGDSKLANILFTRELDRRHRADGIAAVAFHPGNIASSFGRESKGFIRAIYRTPLRHLLSTPEKGGRRLADLAEGAPGRDWEPGRYYENDKPADHKLKGADDRTARELWERSEELLAAAPR